MKKFIFLILGLLFATSAFGQSVFGIGGVRGLKWDGFGLRFQSPADSVIFEIPVSFESTITITTLIGTSFKVFDTDSDSIIAKPSGFALTNSSAVGVYVFQVKDGEGSLNAFSVDSLGNVIMAGDVAPGDDVLLADGAVIGITGNEVITFLAGAGSINFTGATVDIDGAFTATSVGADALVTAETGVTINPTVADGEDPSLILKFDADSDSPANTAETFTISGTAAADPTDATIDYTMTQALGYKFFGDQGEYLFITQDKVNNNMYLESDATQFFLRQSGNDAIALHATRQVREVFSDLVLAGSHFEFRPSSASTELTGNNVKQGLMLVEGEAAQTSTASLDAFCVDIDITSLGDGSAGNGNNLLNLSVSGSPLFRITTDGLFDGDGTSITSDNTLADTLIVTGQVDASTGFTDGTFTVDGSGAFTGVASIVSSGAISGTAITGSAEANFTNNAAAATFGAVGTDADVVLAFDAVTNQGSITYMEDEDRFDFDNDLDVIADLTAGTMISDGVLTALGAFTSLGIDDNADANAITISSGEVVTFVQAPVFASYTRHLDLDIGAAVLGPNAPTATTIGTSRGLGFDADNEAAYVEFEIPSDWDGASNMNFNIHWHPTSGDAIANTEKIKWDAHYRSVAIGEAVDNGTLVTATTTFTGGASEGDKETYQTVIVIVYTGGNQPLTAGDILYIQVDRDVTGEAGGGGSYSGMGIITLVELEYTSNALASH
ncbi:hypothetical protein LCGC14_1421340 [marine sediment metagenome]